MTPIVKLLRLMDGEKPAMGKVYDRMFMIGVGIEKSSVSWKAKAAKIHSDRWEYLHSEMHAAGYALDPEFMEMATDVDEATQSGLSAVIEKICLRDDMEAAANAEAADALTIESDKVQERIGKTMLELATYQQREGIFTKLYVMKHAKTMAPATWWAQYGKHIKFIASVARRVLAQPVCASAAERNWSVYGAIKTTARVKMGHAVADKLVYCHEALHIQSKLQTASYNKQTVEKWDSDSDSDESDEEDLKV